MDDEKNKLIETLTEAISSNPQAEAVFNALVPDEPDEQDKSKKNTNKSDSGFDISMLLKMQNMMSTLNNSGDDDRSRLLLAIKPFLSEERRPQVDSAIKLLKLASLFKLAGELDLFKDFKL